MDNKYLNAKNIKKELDDYVMGQESGKRSIAMAIAQHLLQSTMPKSSDDRIQTDNVLVFGPTGCGKTETWRVLHKLETKFECPVMMFNALDYSGTGSWHNTIPISNILNDIAKESVEIYHKLYGDYEEIETQLEEITKIANHAIIFIDEIDKIAIAGTGNGRLMLEEYQNVLLKVIEGNLYDVQCQLQSRQIELLFDDDEKNIKTYTIKLDTSNMMFIFLGAFTGIQNYTVFRLMRETTNKTKKKSAHKYYQDTHVGFLSKPEEPEKITKKVPVEEIIPSQEDVISYGFKRELVGRIAVRTVYKPLSEDALVDIMLHSKTSAYKEYQRRFQQNGFELKCSRSALREIAKTARQRRTGARGLLTIFSELLSPTLYELSGDIRPIRCLLRGQEIQENKSPLLHDRTEHIIRMEELVAKQVKKKLKFKKIP